MFNQSILFTVASSIARAFLAGIAVLSMTGCQIPERNQGRQEQKMLEEQKLQENPPLYVVIDLAGGPEAANYPYRFSNEPPDLSNDLCRTDELWLRRIPAGKFVMGSPKEESVMGRPKQGEAQHLVSLTKDFYIGVFEVTQKQWKLVMGGFPDDGIFERWNYAAQTNGDNAWPVCYVSYLDIRGNHQGTKWPSGGHAVDENSFLGVLRAKTGLEFDLPTSAQWEYACRAGTTTAFNSGKALVCENGPDSTMDELGRYLYNNQGQSGELANVGSYRPNAWGLYDMHGNIQEWCLDWCASGMDYLVSVDPSGIDDSHDFRVVRGGCYWFPACICRSAFLFGVDPRSNQFDTGFRLVCSVPLSDADNRSTVK